MKRISEHFLIICFLGFLAAGLFFTVNREPEFINFFENRALAAFPAYSDEAVKNGSYASQLEDYLDDHAALRTTLLRLKTCSDLLLRRPVVNGIVITPKCLLPLHSPEAVNENWVAAQAEAMADNLKRINDTVAEYGGYYCYVGVPCQYAYFEDDYPWYLESRSEYSRLSSSLLSRELAERGVAFLDVRAAFEAQGHPDEYGSLVDNHYTMEGAFAAYRLIMEKVAAETGLSFPILDWPDMRFEPLPNDYLGSRERRLMNVVTREEQLTVAYPRQEVPFTRTDLGIDVPPLIYALPYTDTDLMTYTLYMGGDQPNTVIDTDRDELPSILIYGDSFTNAVECVAYLSFDKMHSLDLRSYRKTSLEDYIREFQPEVVICIRDYEALLTLYGNGAAE